MIPSGSPSWRLSVTQGIEEATCAMNEAGKNPYATSNLYIPASLGEIYDLLGAMISDAPTFIDDLSEFPERNIDTVFRQLTESFDIVRKKVGEERYATLTNIAERAKALFLADPNVGNGKTDQGRELLFEIEDIVQTARRKRVKSKLLDDDGEVSGD